MVEFLHRFFDLNNVLVFFLYGLVFFVLGLAIALQSRHHSRLDLAQSLGWLAAFGLTHAFHEWGQIFIPIQASYLNPAMIAFLDTIRLILLAVSFACLFQFGVELVRDRWPRLAAAPLLLMLLWTLLFIMPGLATSHSGSEWTAQASIWARYLLGFPGGTLAAYGLRYQAERQIKPLQLRPIYNTLRVAGLGLFAYAILGGMFVHPATFWPANWLNEANLLHLFGVPVPVFRSLTGLVIAVAMIRALEVFDLEVDRLIEQLGVEQKLATERERIGRELHDGAIQQVYSAGLIVESARRKIEEDSHLAGQRLDRAMIAINESIANLRAYIGTLRPGPKTLSIAAALQQQITAFRLTALLDIMLNLDLPETTVLTPTQMIHIQAIVGEALANAMRHAQAQRVVITAALNNGNLHLTIQDDGQGFSAQSNNAGYGLRNMRDRARLLGGELTLETQSGQGTRITLVTPWEAET